MQRHLHLAFVLLALAASSCRAATPRFEFETPLGSAFSDDPSTARMLAEIGAELAPEVCALLRVEPGPPFQIHHVPTRQDPVFFTESRRGIPVRRWIEIGDDAIRSQPRWAIAHELVHWHVRDTVWERLPNALEEGLADLVATWLVPDMGPFREAALAAVLADITPERRARALATRRDTWMDAPEDVRTDVYMLGLDTVLRIGIEGLRGLCERAVREGLEEVPLAWIDEALAASRCPDCGKPHPRPSLVREEARSEARQPG